MASPAPRPCSAREVSPPVHQVPSTAENQPRSPEIDFDFVEQPSQDFFCPVSLELLLEPQLTSCCGHHLSLEATTRLQREGKTCPMCNGEGWNAVLDKYHRRKVHEVRVRCRYKDNGCEWVGEVNELKTHVDSCVNRPWECKYCAFRCTFGEGKGGHLAVCPKFPKPCPNGCEVGSVERCNMEQHLSVCPLEPVACEMKEFGCNIVVPRKELATHMRESELQHLTAMTMTNLSLTRQLQQESKEKMARIEQRVDELQAVITDQEQKYAEQLKELKAHIETLECTTRHIEHHTAGGVCTACNSITFPYRNVKNAQHCVHMGAYSEPFYSHHHGYKFSLKIVYNGPSVYNGISVYLYLTKGEYDDELCWPVEVKVRLELINQARNHGHLMKAKTLVLDKEKRDTTAVIDDRLMTYPELEMRRSAVQYMMNNCLKFRVEINLLSSLTRMPSLS